MLEPGKRRLLLDALRPPPGYRLDRAVGTSYSLDLLALLTAPLAFTFFDWEDEEGRPTADPLALLEAVRRHAERIHLFCQGGRVEVPKPGQSLYAYLEGSVFEVAPPHPGGSFHPKAWFLRFAAEDEPVRYRMLCLSRNLTFDRSWDTSLVLEGELRDRKKAFAANHPLGDFLAALPELSLRPVPDAVRAGIDRMQEEIRRVDFEFPEHVDEMAFHPLGLHPPGPDGHGDWPFETGTRVLVASPFVDDLLGDLAALGEGAPATLISRPEELRRLEPAQLSDFDPIYVMVPEADPEDADEEAAGQADTDDEDPAEEGSWSGEDRLAGLHAKLFLVERGRRARLYTGSANATRAAFERNVELLVELGGGRKHLGIDALLGEAEEGSGAGFGNLLEEFQPAERAERPDPEEERLERQVDGLRLALARAGLRLRAEPDTEEESFAMVLEAPHGLPQLPAEGSLRAWPITLHPHAARPLSDEGREAARFEGLSFTALTAFTAFEAELRRGGFTKRARFVLALPLEGAPRDRRERILRSLLKDREQVMRLLWLLLSQEEISAASLQEAVAPAEGGARPYGASALPGFPLLERLLQALDRDPGRLDEIARLVEDLGRTPEGRELLPERLNAVWDPVWRVRREGRP